MKGHKPKPNHPFSLAIAARKRLLEARALAHQVKAKLYHRENADYLNAIKRNRDRKTKGQPDIDQVNIMKPWDHAKGKV